MKKARLRESETGPRVVVNRVQLRMPGATAAMAAVTLSASAICRAAPLVASHCTTAGDVAVGCGATALMM